MSERKQLYNIRSNIFESRLRCIRRIKELSINKHKKRPFTPRLVD